MKLLSFLLLIFLALNISAQSFKFSTGINLSRAGNLSELNQRLIKFGAPTPINMIGGEMEFSYITKNKYSFSMRPVFVNSTIANDSIYTYSSKVILTINFGKIFQINDDFKIKPTLGYATIFFNLNSKFKENTLISTQSNDKLPTTSFYQLSTYAHSLIFGIESITYDKYSLLLCYTLSLHNQEWISNFYSFDQLFYDNLSAFSISLKYYFN